MEELLELKALLLKGDIKGSLAIVEDLEGYSAPVTASFLKEVFKTIMYTMYRKTSTTDLTTAEMTECFDVFAKFLSENYGVDIVWPSQDSLALQALIDSQV
jgi:hypothetical protein